MKEFLISILLLINFFILNAFTEIQFYRSNYNGLLLLNIKESEKSQYKHVVKSIITDEKLISKTLYEKDKEVKRWEYIYSEDKLREENYYKDFNLTEKFIYDTAGHKLNLVEYRDGRIMKNTSYEYNKDGLLSKEIINDLYLNRVNSILYRYDSQYRIKQIITEMHDGKIVYWDSFFTAKGIIVKEYYTLKDKRYIFYYNPNGQEIKGEVLSIDTAGVEKETLKWDNIYSKAGIRILKDETNLITKKQIKTWYDEDGRDIKEHILSENAIEMIKEKAFDDKDNLIMEKQIVGLNIKQTNFYYKEKLYKTETIENGIIKEIETIHDDGSKNVLIYGTNNVVIEMTYDVDGNKISENYKFK